jgi:hypothetical protein
VVMLESWVLYFPVFADLNHEYVSPYCSNVAMIDGTFTECSRPDYLPNVYKQNPGSIGPAQFFEFYKEKHRVQTMAAYCPNGMMAV